MCDSPGGLAKREPGRALRTRWIGTTWGAEDPWARGAAHCGGSVESWWESILVTGDTFEDSGVDRVLVQRVADIPHERHPELRRPRQVVRRTTLHCLELVRTDSKRA